MSSNQNTGVIPVTQSHPVKLTTDLEAWGGRLFEAHQRVLTHGARFKSARSGYVAACLDFGDEIIAAREAFESKHGFWPWWNSRPDLAGCRERAARNYIVLAEHRAEVEAAIKVGTPDADFPRIKDLLRQLGYEPGGRSPDEAPENRLVEANTEPVEPPPEPVVSTSVHARKSSPWAQRTRGGISVPADPPSSAEREKAALKARTQARDDVILWWVNAGIEDRRVFAEHVTLRNFAAVLPHPEPEHLAALVPGPQAVALFRCLARVLEAELGPKERIGAADGLRRLIEDTGQDVTLVVSAITNTLSEILEAAAG